MIALDIETSGLSPVHNGIWQIGALELENPNNTFLQESRIDDDDKTLGEALTITGKTEDYLRDKNKQTQKQLIENFFDWIKKVKTKNLICQNPAFDIGFLNNKAIKYGIINNNTMKSLPFPYRTFDLHSVAQTVHKKVNGNLMIDEKKKHSSMGLGEIMKFCGIGEDGRMKIENGNKIKPGKPHNALEDARITAECFSRLMYGKGLLEKYSKHKMPGSLIK